MDHLYTKLCLLVLMSAICFQTRAEVSSGSIAFLDNPNHRYLRMQSPDGSAEAGTMFLSDVGAAVSILLGFTPPASLSADSSFKLNEFLLPNPFNRPRAVFLLEVEGIEEQQLPLDYFGNSRAGNTFRSRVLLDSGKVDIQLPGGKEVSVISLEKSFGSDCDATCADTELLHLASALGGSYVSYALEPFSGVFTVMLPSGTTLSLHLSKKADRKFAVSLVSLIHSTRRASKRREEFSGNMQSQAEFVTGCFTGIKALQEQSGPGGAQQGMELLLTTLTMLFDSLQEAYKGQLVGAVLFKAESEPVFSVKYTSHPSSRLLEELTDIPDISALVERQLVRTVLAWATGIILLISTLLGIYFLVNMPITRDTLLYSNVKLD
ncbi:hypothetical protein GIB67_008141 [Kingdonia uniflora]|uniref:DUF7794 domain-containing protein n=1 Tax=Kingdonia uniflora TaxID=39325 RepID=A0A7J7MT77_9MAGN|nr:hypothetical protein GIB67_008141 [Kingdonia uniflora]